MADETLTDFVETVCGESRLRVEQDFGGGFVRLRSTEAEKRQAAQDIRCTEDIVIELLRNARDAQARSIFVALQREEDRRSLVVIDDGCGIPASMRERIFEPRVTSKLDTAHMDKWGMHGRGMALYSISVNATSAQVAYSQPDGGSALAVSTDLSALKEKTDQSTFPRFEVVDGTYVMRGPRNIVRTCAEFALEHRRDCTVYCGSFTEIAATLYAYGMAATTAAQRAFGGARDDIPAVKLLAFATDPDDLAARATQLGLVLSSRSARRIIDGAIAPAPSLMERLEQESFPKSASPSTPARTAKPLADARGLKLAPEDAASLKAAAKSAFADIAARYYLEPDVEPEVRATGEGIRIFIPANKLR